MTASSLELLDLDRPIEPGTSEPWAIVLAGGQGRRLSEIAWKRYGYPRPKQFCAFDDRGTLLEQTLERVRPIVAHERLVVVTTRAHRDEARECLSGWPHVRHVEQPRSCETTPGLILPLLHVLAQDADATVMMLPSDHHIDDDDAFRAALMRARGAVDHDPDKVALLGVAPDEAEDGYGWIVPVSLRDRHWSAVRCFREKPPIVEAEVLRAQGALLNTFVIVARARALARLCMKHTPLWWRALSRAAFRPSLLEAAYATLPSSNFSTDVLEPAASDLRVVSLADAGWSDIGTPDRLHRVLRGREPQPVLMHAEAG